MSCKISLIVCSLVAFVGLSGCAGREPQPQFPSPDPHTVDQLEKDAVEVNKKLAGVYWDSSKAWAEVQYLRAKASYCQP